MSVVLLDIPGITNPAVLVFAMGKLKEYFFKSGEKPPKLPENISSYMPFRICITEEIDESAKQFRRIQFIKNDGSVAYQAEWIY